MIIPLVVSASLLACLQSDSERKILADHAVRLLGESVDATRKQIAEATPEQQQNERYMTVCRERVAALEKTLREISPAALKVEKLEESGYLVRKNRSGDPELQWIPVEDGKTRPITAYAHRAGELKSIKGWEKRLFRRSTLSAWKTGIPLIPAPIVLVTGLDEAPEPEQPPVIEVQGKLDGNGATPYEIEEVPGQSRSGPFYHVVGSVKPAWEDLKREAGRTFLYEFERIAESGYRVYVVIRSMKPAAPK